MIREMLKNKWGPTLLVYVAIYLIVIFLDVRLGGFLSFYFNPVIFHYLSLIIIISLFYGVTNEWKKNTQIAKSLKHFDDVDQKENNRLYVILLLIIFALGTFLRLYHLGELSPAGDEYRHLLAMKRFLTDGIFGYTTSSITTLIITGVKKITTSDSLFLLRLPFALLGSLSILLFYAIGKKIATRQVGLIAAYLFAFLPLAVGLSNYIRGYEIALFVSLVAIYFLFSPYIKNLYFKIVLFILSLKLIAYLNSDQRFDAMVMFFAIFALFYGGLMFIDEIIKNKRWNNIIKITAPFIAFVAGISIMPLFFEFSFSRTVEWGYLFLINHSYSDVTWYFEIIPFIVIIFFIISAFFAKIKKKNVIYALSFTLIFIIAIFMFYFDGPKRFQVRYLYPLFPYFILLLSIGISSAYYIFKRIFKVGIIEYSIVSVIVFITIFSPVKAFYFTFTETNGEHSKLNQLTYLPDKELITFVNAHNIDVSKIITTTPWVFDFYYDQPFLMTGELNQYVHFPKEWNYEFVNRTKLYSISGFRSEEEIKTINEIIDTRDIEYLIFHSLPQHSDYRYSYEYPLETIRDTELVTIIGENSSYGYYIYKINKES
ncbi:hypothetical protein COB64_00470 [Candidatus Wolfebacteria bacterium]|nr:MAG: hypothetical protein COB64_00470 [Candidatus Wolfebacteria bacterium]